jgi:hypothetical protein
MVQPTYSLDNGPNFNIGPNNELLVPGDILQGTQFKQLGPLTPAVVSYHDDFLGAAIQTVPYVFKKGSDAACANPAIVAATVNGNCRLTTGANAGVSMATNGSQLLMELNTKLNNGATVLEAAVGNVAAAIANLVIFFGWSDQNSALQMPGTVSGTTFTAAGTDLIGFIYDTSATNAFWQSISTNNTTVKALTTSAVAPPITATYNRLRIETNVAGDASFYIDGVLLNTITAAARATVPLTPTLACFSRAATSKTVDMDYMAFRQARQY